MAIESHILIRGIALATFLAPSSAVAQQPDLTLDSLLNVPVSAAAKYAQRSSEAAASVTILSAEDISTRGFRTLQEVLESVRGFYVTNDRNYPYLGTRGFSRPSDYNNRILLLVDGHTINEQIWGSAPIGSDLPLNLDAVERIEIVRGPGSALYGSSAMFGVINVVSKTGAQLGGTTVTARGGSGAMRELGIASGRTFGADGSLAFSGLFTTSDGMSQYYPEYDTPQSNGGVVTSLDWEKGASGIAMLQWRGVTGRAGFRSRRKGIPTGAYETLFGDPRARTHDETGWAELAGRRQLGGTLSSSVRAFVDGYRYTGGYPADASPTFFRDRATNFSVGGEGLLVWDPLSRNRVSLGVDARQVLQATYDELFADGTSLRTDADFTSASVFAQNELDITSRATLVTGARFDARTNERSALSPRAGLIVRFDSRAVAKLLYGEAFRAPSPSEKQFQTGWYEPSPALRAERIRTTELEVQRTFVGSVLVTASAFDYRVADLIDQVADGTGGVRFQNVSRAHAMGAEMQVDMIPAWSPLTARATYAIQNAHDASEAELTNSPTRITTLSLAPRASAWLRPAVDVRHETGRLTLAGARTAPFTRADINLGVSPSWLRNGAISLRVTNVFDAAVFTPGGIEHRQDAVRQDGRMTSGRLVWRF